MTAKHLYSYLLRCYRFGVFACVAMSLAKIFSPREEVPLRIPGLRGTVFARKHTSDQDAFDQVFAEQGYAHPFLEGFSPKTIIDAGAYAGYSTVYFANRYPAAKIIAIEPEASNFALLKKNAAGYQNVTCIQAALWNKTGKVSVVSTDSNRHWSFRVREYQEDIGVEGESVPALTIPEIMDTYALDAVDILKIDIEGAEKELFSRNYESWIARCKVIIIELHERFAPGCSKAFYSALSAFPFRQYIRRENVFVDLRNSHEN